MPWRAVGSLQLGATFDDRQADIALRVFSHNASRVEVWVYDKPFAEGEKARYVMQRDPTTEIWQKIVPAAELKAEGINEPERGTWTQTVALGQFRCRARRFLLARPLFLQRKAE